MASITTWTRLEPGVLGAAQHETLKARIFDPLWMLARQRQLGEMQGDDNGTPVFARLRAEFKRVLESPDVKQKLNAAGGLDPYVASPEEFAALIRRDYAKFARLVKDIKLKID